MAAQQKPTRVFISYAHDNEAHVDRVRDLWFFLRANGVDARLDLGVARGRVDWALWTAREIRDADWVLIVASPEYRRRAEGDAGPTQGQGVQWEARIIRELFYADQMRGLQRFVPVLLTDCSADDIPLWLGPMSLTHYTITENTVTGAEKLLRLLTDQPYEVEPPLGPVPILLPLQGPRADKLTSASGGIADPVMLDKLPEVLLAVQKAAQEAAMEPEIKLRRIVSDEGISSTSLALACYEARVARQPIRRILRVLGSADIWLIGAAALDNVLREFNMLLFSRVTDDQEYPDSAAMEDLYECYLLIADGIFGAEFGRLFLKQLALRTEGEIRLRADWIERVKPSRAKLRSRSWLRPLP